MKTLFGLFLVLQLVSCASDKPKFSPTKTCSSDSIKYLQSPHNQTKRYLDNPYLREKIAKTRRSMQLCYEDFKNRSGEDEDFNTCMVIGVDEYGLMEYYNFSSNDVKLDRQFVECANQVANSVDFSSFGWNYLLVHTYRFYVD